MNRKPSWARRLLSPAIRRGRGIVRDEQGAVAIEFGILAVPFFALIFAIIETSMGFFAQQILESALQDATRYIRTGQSQTTWGQTEFRSAICSGTFGLFDCSTDGGRLWVKVAPATTFTAATQQMTKPIADTCTITTTNLADCNWNISETYDDGAGSAVIIAQAYYKWPTIINLPWFNFANQAGNNRLLSAVRVFKNEPF